RTLFNEVALSPYTEFVGRFLDFWRMLVEGEYLSLAEHADFLSYLLRQNARHLTAYDLITFHHRGANYPDALLLHAVLQENIRLIDAHPELFCNATDTDGRRQWQRRRRRRGLRQGWVMWHLSQGLPIPDMPTSPGENVRILPPPFIRVPDEQILTPSKRTKRLFAGQCLPLPTDQNEKIFQECIADLR